MINSNYTVEKLIKTLRKCKPHQVIFINDDIYGHMQTSITMESSMDLSYKYAVINFTTNKKTNTVHSALCILSKFPKNMQVLMASTQFLAEENFQIIKYEDILEVSLKLENEKDFIEV